MTAAPPDQAVRDRVTRDFSTTFVLEAGAGTGKTTVLVARIVALVRSGAATLDRIVAITFTEKAAGELRLRVRDELENAVGTASGVERERLARATVDLERAPVSTIHAFAASILKERPFEAGLDPGFSVAADVAGERSFDEAWSAWLDERVSAGDPVIVRALHLGLDFPDLQKAARRLVSERDILGRPARRPPFDPAGLLGAIKAALRALEPLERSCTDETDGAYQSILALEEFASRADRLDGTSLEGFLRGLRVNTKNGRQASWKPKEACAEVKQELKALAEAKARWVAASDADVAASLRALLCDFLASYERMKRERAIVDFQDLLLRTRDVLASFPSVRRYFQARFDRVLIDEFQDTDPLQAEIAFFLAEDPSSAAATDWRSVKLQSGKLFVVGDPKQSIYRFRRADLSIYEEVKRLVVAAGGEVLPLTTNFRTVPSILEFVNERFDDVFSQPGDPTPRGLDPSRVELAKGGARTVALSLPPAAMPPDLKVPSLLPVLASTIAAFIDQITRAAPWQVRDAKTKQLRSARPGDVALLVRKMTPGFIGPFEEELRKRAVAYRLVGGKEYYARDEVQALTAVLRAIDNPADRLSLVLALRSPFFGVSDDDLFRYVSAGGTLNLLAPPADAATNRDLFAGIFDLLGKLHRKRRLDPPSVVIEELLARSRALDSFLLRTDGAQMVANLWRVLDVARAYEAAAPTTLRAFVRFLEEEAQSGREEGDTPVGEQVGSTVEVVTVHKAKGLEYPIVIVGDLISDQTPGPDAIVDHAAGEGWLKVGPFAPAGWKERAAWEKSQQDAEGRRLLYVALTRARDHLVIPCLPGARKEGWLDQACAGFVTVGTPPPFGRVAKTVRNSGAAGDARVTWFDSNPLALAAAAPAAPRGFAVLEGTDEDLRAAADAENAWQAARKKIRKAARTVENPPTAMTSLVGDGDAASTAARGPLFGQLLHGLLATTPLEAADLLGPAHTLARSLGATEDDAEAAARLARQTLDQPLLRSARRARRCYRELPISTVVDGKRLTGRIDLAFEHDEGWTIVDYKTEVVAPDRMEEAARHHAPQVQAYRRAFAAQVKADVRAVVLFVESQSAIEFAEGG